MKKSVLMAIGGLVWIFAFSFDHRLCADTPLPPPEAKEVWSPNKRFCAAMDPKARTTVVYRVAKDGHRTRSWTMKGWFRVAHLADDGEHLVVGHDGINLLPTNVAKEEPMIRFFKRGKLFNIVALGELQPDLKKLKRTVSHYHWGSYLGFDKEGHYVVETVDGRKLAFDVNTGMAVGWWNMLRMPGRSHQGPLPVADEHLRLLAAELRRDVTQLAEKIGERNVRHPEELAQAANWIETKLAKLGFRVKRQRYEVSKVSCCNLEAEVVGTAAPEEIVIVGAHYDSAEGTPGANDNASGVAALLALADKYAQRKPARTLRFVAFVNEEPPFFQTARMGSWVYAKRCRQRNEKIVAMLSLETIGYYSDAPGSQRYPPPFSLLYPSTGNFVGFIGNSASASLVHRVVGTFRQYEPFPSEGGAPPSGLRGVGFSDQWSFWQEGYPGLMVTDTAMFRYSYYHEAEDTPDKIDFERMARVVRGLDKVVGDLAGVSGNDSNLE